MEKRYTLILGQNGTQLQLLEDGPVSPLIPGIFLTLHFALGLALNIALILGILTNAALRGINFNRLLVQLALACAFDCFLNVTAAVIFLAVTHLDLSSKYGREVVVACRLNATLMEWTAVSQSVFLAALVGDRTIALQQDKDKNKASSSSFVTRAISVLLWFYTTLIVAPVAVTSSVVDISFFPHRYSCGLVPNSEDIGDLIYPLLLLVLGYIVPWTVTAFGFLKVVRHILATRRRRRLLEEAGLARSQRLQETSSWTAGLAWDEVTFYRLVSALLLGFFVLTLPHNLYVNILTLSLSNACQHSKCGRPSDDKSTEISELLTGTLDCIFVWCRYSFILIAPVMVLAMHKEVRKSCEHLFCCCCRGNTVVHLDDARSISACVQKRMEQEAKNKTPSLKIVRGKKGKYTRAASYRTPVLFATSEGLHLRLVDDNADGYVVNRVVNGDKEQRLSSEPRFICEFCDVAILTPSQLENGINPSSSFRQSFIARRPKPPIFTPEVLPEEDMHVTDSSGDYPTRILATTQEHNSSEKNASRHNNINNNNQYCNNRNFRKPPRVRFAQTVSEIPLSESGVWSAPEDHNLATDQSQFGMRVPPPERQTGAPS